VDCGEFVGSALQMVVPHPLVHFCLWWLAVCFHSVWLINRWLLQRPWMRWAHCQRPYRFLFLFFYHYSLCKRLARKQTYLLAVRNCCCNGCWLCAGFIHIQRLWFLLLRVKICAQLFLYRYRFFCYFKWGTCSWRRKRTGVNADRWLIFIFFFMIGLSIGVHLLNLLTIPLL